MKILVQLNRIREEYKESLEKVRTTAELNDWKASYLGKNGKLSVILSALKELSLEEKKAAGSSANEIKNEIEKFYASYLKKLASESYLKKIEKIGDPTLPSVFLLKGHPHPLYKTMREIIGIFVGFGFDIALGPEMEDEYHNFTALNFPESHPAKEMQDTFYVNSPSGLLLRTHTSPVQIRVMANSSPPLKFIAPGRVYRHEAVDASHSCVFHQVEGFCVDKTANLSDLKSILEIFVCRFFKKKLKIRFRPSFFPFTEPSVEVDVECLMCGSAGCRVCKNSGYLEMLGAGMVHPNVLKNCGINPEEFQGYAFGLGVERFAMLKYNIDDMRLFYQNDIRFLRQF